MVHHHFTRRRFLQGTAAMAAAPAQHLRGSSEEHHFATPCTHRHRLLERVYREADGPVRDPKAVSWWRCRWGRGHIVGLGQKLGYCPLEEHGRRRRRRRR